MATRSATLAGWFTCGSGLKMPEPMWMRSVAWARYPATTSLADRCEYSSRKWCSVTHTYLKPALSAAFDGVELVHERLVLGLGEVVASAELRVVALDEETELHGPEVYHARML